METKLAIPLLLFIILHSISVMAGYLCLVVACERIVALIIWFSRYEYIATRLSHREEFPSLWFAMLLCLGVSIAEYAFRRMMEDKGTDKQEDEILKNLFINGGSENGNPYEESTSSEGGKPFTGTPR